MGFNNGNKDNEGIKGKDQDKHDYVDLGLPSGTLWATCNVGATTPEGYGDYFAWGETQSKTIYDWTTYKWCKGDYDQLTKYCNYADFGYNDFADNLTALQPTDDAASTNWGNGWCIPTKEQWQELYQNTSSTWTTLNGVNGRHFTASNGRSIFLPAAGKRYWNDLGFEESYGFYWSSTLDTSFMNRAWDFYFYMDGYNIYNYIDRVVGHSVRAVWVAAQN